MPRTKSASLGSCAKPKCVGIGRRRRSVKTTRRDLDGRPAPDLVDRNFTSPGPDQIWVADITYVPTELGFCSWRWWSMPSAAAWSAGRWPLIYAPSSS